MEQLGLEASREEPARGVAAELRPALRGRGTRAAVDRVGGEGWLGVREAAVGRQEHSSGERRKIRGQGSSCGKMELPWPLWWRKGKRGMERRPGQKKSGSGATAPRIGKEEREDDQDTKRQGSAGAEKWPRQEKACAAGPGCQRNRRRWSMSWLGLVKTVQGSSLLNSAKPEV